MENGDYILYIFCSFSIFLLKIAFRQVAIREIYYYILGLIYTLCADIFTILFLEKFIGFKIQIKTKM